MYFTHGSLKPILAEGALPATLASLIPSGAPAASTQMAGSSEAWGTSPASISQRTRPKAKMSVRSHLRRGARRCVVCAGWHCMQTSRCAVGIACKQVRGLALHATGGIAQLAFGFPVDFEACGSVKLMPQTRPALAPWARPGRVGHFQICKGHFQISPAGLNCRHQIGGQHTPNVSTNNLNLMPIEN